MYEEAGGVQQFRGLRQVIIGCVTLAECLPTSGSQASLLGSKGFAVMAPNGFMSCRKERNLGYLDFLPIRSVHSWIWQPWQVEGIPDLFAR